MKQHWLEQGLGPKRNIIWTDGGESEQRFVGTAAMRGPDGETNNFWMVEILLVFKYGSKPMGYTWTPGQVFYKEIVSNNTVW